jgi:hypothetical protein
MNRWSPPDGWDRPLPGELDSPQTLVLAFGTPETQRVAAPLAALRRAFPHSLLAGCSTAGEIFEDLVYDDTLAVAVVRFERARVRGACAPVTGAQDSHRAGELLGRMLAGPDLRSVLVFSDGLKVNGSELVRGLLGAVPPGVTISGGLAADAARFHSTWVLRDGHPAAGCVVAVGIEGPVVVTTGSQGGWDTFGPERRVTRASGNVLYELDGRPALELYSEYLGELAAELPASALLFPLAVRIGGDESEPIVRTVLGVDEQAQSMTFAGDVPQGCLARLMRANHERLIRGARDAAVSARAAMRGDGPALALAISCVGRRLVLKQRIDEETEATLGEMPKGSSQIGFYSYGEISPSGPYACDLHNQTMTLTTLREEIA